MKYINHFLSSIFIISSLAGCGAGTESSSDSTCASDIENSVQWNKLCTITATKLSEYQLFESTINPTINPNSTGLPYDLSTPLFTDYASKYRFVFVPPDKSASYIEDEIFDFPLGTTLVKTFALPTNTDNRGLENENLIETRLLIKRKTGWVTLPYVWNNNKTDAILDTNGASIASTITHGGVTTTFDYNVPDPQSCVNCHGFSESAESETIKTPIGPKARFLNKNYAYADGTKNQLLKWAELGILTGLPSDIANIDKAPIVSDATNIGDLSNDELELAAKSWLDINCGHCHRREPHGLASNTNMQVEWTLGFASDPSAHGVCQKPISYGGGNLSYIIEPGSAERSIMIERMSATTGSAPMPPLGRGLVHQEGVELISAWIDSMDTNSNCK